MSHEKFTPKDLTIIPKDCSVCDGCNKQLTDENFVAIQDCVWFEGYLYCQGCEQRYRPKDVGLSLIKRICMGDDLSDTELAKPIVIESW